MKDYKCLGWENAWSFRGEKPQEVKDCKHRQELERIKVTPTETTIICHSCKIYWSVDSSD